MNRSIYIFIQSKNFVIQTHIEIVSETFQFHFTQTEDGLLLHKNNNKKKKKNIFFFANKIFEQWIALIELRLLLFQKIIIML